MPNSLLRKVGRHNKGTMEKGQYGSVGSWEKSKQKDLQSKGDWEKPKQLRGLRICLERHKRSAEIKIMPKS